jgi:hypothetical protein
MKKLLVVAILGLAINTGSFAEGIHPNEYGRWVNEAGDNLCGDSMVNPDAGPNWNQNSDPDWDQDADPMWDGDVDPMDW